MSVHDLLDKELAEVLARSKMLPQDWSQVSVAEIPALRAKLVPTPPERPLPEGVTGEIRRVPGLDGDPDVEITIYRPSSEREIYPALFWAHGGGHMAGTVRHDQDRMANWVLDHDCIIVSVEYRLAPESLYPAALHDCYAALLWMFQNAEELKIDPNRIGVSGLSSGAGLAASVTLLARDRGEIDIRFQLIIYAMLDDRCESSSMYMDLLTCPRESTRVQWRAYLGCEPGSDGISAYAAPSRAESFQGLPSAFICVGSLDSFHDENIAYAQSLLSAGVLVDLHVYAGAPHGFIRLAPETAIAKRCYREIGDFLERQMYPQGRPQQ